MYYSYNLLFLDNKNVFIMKEIKEAKPITPMDLAKILGVQKEYAEMLFEQQLKKNKDIVIGDDFENEKNNIIDNDNDV